VSRPFRIGVIGGHECDPETAEAARRVGAGIARAGAVLVCGGLGGVMEEAASGAREAGGITVGLLPGDDPEAANPGIVISLATGLGEARNVLVVRGSEAVIAIGGNWGTLSEAAFCLKLGVPLIRLRSEILALPVPEASEPGEAVAWALEQARGRSKPGT
jgi:uncharacterized protein (TIGR00725 family)